MFIDAPPNFERSGVVAGFILGPGSDLTPVLSRGVLFAQGAIYRPAAAPALPAAPAARQSWLFFNFQSGFYWAAAPVATAPDDALLGWALADAARVIAVSRQRIFVPDPKENITVIPLGPVLAQAAGGPSFGDTAPPPEPSFGTNASGRGVLEIAGLAFLTLENTRSIGSATFRIFYRDETGAASGDLAADVDAAAAIFPVSNGAGFSAGGLYLLDAEIVQVTAINGNNLSVARARLATAAAAHFGPKAITGATNATPIVLTCAGHGRANLAIAAVSGAAGNTAANGAWEIANATADTFELVGSSGSGAYTGGGTLAGSRIYGLQERVVISGFQPEFFGTPASGKWFETVELPSASVVAIECWVNNALGQSPSKINPYASLPTRTLSGGQIDLEVEGLLGIQSDVVPEITMPNTASPEYVFAYLKQPPSGAKVTLVVKLDGAAWATLTIAEGQTLAVASRTGRALGGIAAGTRIGLDITGVGTVFPGERLVVQIKF